MDATSVGIVWDGSLDGHWTSIAVDTGLWQMARRNTLRRINERVAFEARRTSCRSAYKHLCRARSESRTPRWCVQ